MLLDMGLRCSPTRPGIAVRQQSIYVNNREKARIKKFWGRLLPLLQLIALQPSRWLQRRWLTFWFGSIDRSTTRIAAQQF